MYLCVIRKLLFIHVLLHLPLLTSAETAYYVSDTETTWDVARSSCSLATPDITNSDTGITAAINLSGLGVANGEQLWLGYFMAYQLFEYIGCVKLATIQSMSSANFSTLTDPGQCYSACGNKGTIGMTFMTEATVGCFCLERPLIFTIDRENGCDKSCIKNVEGPACGGDRFVSVYKTVLGLSVNDVQTYANVGFKGDCVDYEQPTQLYHWNTCERKHKIVCYTGTEAIFPSEAPSGSWLFSSVYCFRNQLYPVTNEIIRTVDKLNLQPTKPTWTAMFRSIVIGKYNDAGTPLQHGYLEVNSDMIVNVAFRDTTATYKSLCLQESTQSTSTHTSPATTTQTSTNMPETTSGKDTEDDIKTTQPTTKQTSTYTSLKTSTQTSTNIAETTSDKGTGKDTKNTQLTTQPTATHTGQKATAQTSTDVKGTSDKDTGKDTKYNQLYMYVGVGGGVMFLAIIIIIVVVVVRRRKGKPKATSMKDTHVKDVPENPYSGEDYVQVDYSQVTYEKGDNKPGGYSEVKTTFKTAEQTISDEDDVYDTTNTSKPDTAIAKGDNKYSSDNIYNRLNVAEDNTYSHIDINRKALQKDGHKLSDHSPSGLGSKPVGNSFTDNLYDRTDDIKDINDDTYSHLNQGLKKRNQNDDLYSKTGTFKSA